MPIGGMAAFGKLRATNMEAAVEKVKAATTRKRSKLFEVVGEIGVAHAACPARSERSAPALMRRLPPSASSPHPHLSRPPRAQQPVAVP